MAEVIAAVSLASAVVQFVDFASKIVSKGNEYRKSANGATEEHERLKSTASRLQELSAGLDVSLGTLTDRPALSREEAALQIVVQTCQKTSTDLISALGKLQCKGHVTFWKSSRQALKSIWAKEDIERRLQTLQDARSEVTVHLLVILSQHSEEGFQRLAKNNKASEEALLNAIQMFRSEAGRDIDRLFLAIDAVRKDTVLTKDQWRQAEDERQLDHLYDNKDITAHRALSDFEKIFLSSLLFPKITERYENISKAHLETFKWIFDDSLRGPILWSDIAEWFRSPTRDNTNPTEPSTNPIEPSSDPTEAPLNPTELSLNATKLSTDPTKSSIYWISGKPGSGKSTLMRYLSDDQQNHSRTQGNLKSWANDRKLLKASCFFWAAGTSMQKSMNGLIQSLLYELLSQDPDLISKVPQGRRAWNSPKIEPWTNSSLRTALELIIKSTPNTHAICLFVDGLDEFEGTDETREVLVQFFQKLSEYPNVKLCLSSRPWLVFNDAFEHGPSLQLEDLTREDIRKYVKKELEEHPRFLHLKNSNPEESTTVVSEITEKAEGVFLWVILVVRSLLEGLRNEDNCADLLRRLAIIPSDLEEYFHLIINSIEPFYFPQSCQVFQMVMEAKIDLSLPTLVFANDKEWYKSATSVRDQSTDKLAEQLLSMRRRLNVLCKGLLEVHERKGHNTMFQFSVDYLHRTVHDFLWLPEVKQKIDNGAPKDFNANISLGQAHLAQIVLLDKKGAITTGYNASANLGDLMKLTDKILIHAVAIELMTQKAPDELLKILGEKIDSISSAENWEALTTSQADHPRNLQCCGQEFWTNWVLWQNSFLSLLITAGLKIYATQQLEHHPNSVRDKRGRPLLDYALRPGLEANKPFRRPPIVELVKKMLEQGADPNQKYQQTTVWGLFLQALSKAPIPPPKEWVQAAELLIEFGAKLKAEAGHEKMIPARRIDSWLQVSAEIDRSDKGKACLSSESEIDAVMAFSAFSPQDAKRLAQMLRSRSGPHGTPTSQKAPSSSPDWRMRLKMVFRRKKGT